MINSCLLSAIFRKFCKRLTMCNEIGLESKTVPLCCQLLQIAIPIRYQQLKIYNKILLSEKITINAHFKYFRI